jgi:hypothetical protein
MKLVPAFTQLAAILAMVIDNLSVAWFFQLYTIIVAYMVYIRPRRESMT